MKQALMLETDRPLALREAIMACRNGGVVSVVERSEIDPSFIISHRLDLEEGCLRLD